MYDDNEHGEEFNHPGGTVLPSYAPLGETADEKIPEFINCTDHPIGSGEHRITPACDPDVERDQETPIRFIP